MDIISLTDDWISDGVIILREYSGSCIELLGQAEAET